MAGEDGPLAVVERGVSVANPNDDPRGELHPQVKALYAMLMGGRVAERLFEAGAMQALDTASAGLFNIGAPELPVAVEIQIPSPGGSVRGLVFSPEHAEGDLLPVLLFMHGGGFVVWSPETHAKLTKRLANGGGAIVVSLDYRRAPEHEYPAALDDTIAAVRWLRANAASLGGDASRVGVAGDSAGGNLAAAVTLRLIAEGEAPPTATVLICGWTDMANSTPSFDAFGPDDPVIDHLVMDFFRRAYAPALEPWDDPFVSPLRGDLGAFPPTCLVIGGIDPLRDDGVRFAEKLRAAGRDVEQHLYDGMPHEFVLWVPPLDDAQPAIDAMCGFLRRTLAPGVS